MYGYGFCMGTGPGFVFKYIYTYNNIVIYYLVLERINDTIKNERTSSFSRVKGVVVVGCSRELPTTLENELLISCSRMVWWWWCQGVTTLDNEHARLVFEDGGGGGGAKE